MAESQEARRIAEAVLQRKFQQASYLAPDQKRLVYESDTYRLARFVEAFLTEQDELRDRLTLIARNAESWHHDEEAKGKALAVIADWAHGRNIPEVLLADLHAPPVEAATDEGER